VLIEVVVNVVIVVFGVIVLVLIVVVDVDMVVEVIGLVVVLIVTEDTAIFVLAVFITDAGEDSVFDVAVVNNKIVVSFLNALDVVSTRTVLSKSSIVVVRRKLAVDIIEEVVFGSIFANLKYIKFFKLPLHLLCPNYLNMLCINV
jgi:hypothetical protein